MASLSEILNSKAEMKQQRTENRRAERNQLSQTRDGALMAITANPDLYTRFLILQAVMVGELNITRQKYELTVKKVDSTNPNKGLAGARFLVSSENGAFSKEIVTGQDGTYTLTALDAGTYAVSRSGTVSQASPSPARSFGWLPPQGVKWGWTA